VRGRNSKAHALLLPDGRESALYRYFSARSPREASRPSAAVLVQSVEDPYYFGLFGLIVSALRNLRALRPEQFVLNSPRVGESRSVRRFLQSRFINWLSLTKWIRLYRAYCGAVGYRGAGLRHPISDAVDLWRAFVSWRGIVSREKLLALSIEGVPAGDLINDAYLRFKPAPTVDLADSYLWLTIWNAHRQIRRARNYFRRVRPILYLTSYSTYIQHGAAVRVALQNGVRVYSFSNYQEFAKELSLEDWVHTKNPDGYAGEFATLSSPQGRLAEAEKALQARIAGAIDTTSGYMKKSAYAESAEPVPDVRAAVVIFLHDFFDSPHVYRDLVFADFWEWICFTIETLRGAGIPFVLKPHPNQIALNGPVIEQLQLRYPGLSIISAKITNLQLVQAGMACAVTVYGTVAHEMAFLGIPTIACGHHPHVSFDFCKTAGSRAEYAGLLRRSVALEFDKAEMRRQSLMFFYMHNLNLGEEARNLRDAVADFRKAAADPAATGQDLVRSLDVIAALPAFRDYISALAKIGIDR
jgi:predicted pyridoxine 5'-phosphate oxidase superfamily flavin-nucleotide-binding protein